MSETPKELPKIAYSELTMGRVVGQGGFSVVSEIISLDLDEVYDTGEQETRTRQEFLGEFRASKKGGKHPYVMKTLRTDLPVEEHVKGVVDLAIEADFLRVLQHPNIIRMRAVANTDPRENRFFVVLDRLGSTLELKFNYWRKLVGESAGYWVPCFGYCCAKAPALHAVWKERITTARDIARAVQYLHSQKICYRDLKPDNLGFDAVTGQVMKLFDFGLAKRLQDAQRHEMSGLYLLTGNTGSLRYMAPEVAADQPYNQSVDAYSFGILFWQICALQTPFAGMSQRAHSERVVSQGQRPKPDRSWPATWVDLMTSCWDGDCYKRPSFDEIVENLEERVKELEEEDGIVPTRASEIRAKKRKKKPQAVDERLNTDTRLSTEADRGNRRIDGDIV